MVSKLWTPPGVTHVGGLLTVHGFNTETGAHITIHTFHFHDKASGRRSVIKIPDDGTLGKAHVEDMAAQAFENWLVEIRTDGKKRAPSVPERKEIGKALEEFRQYASKRRQSTNQRIFYDGLGGR